MQQKVFDALNAVRTCTSSAKDWIAITIADLARISNGYPGSILDQATAVNLFERLARVGCITLEDKPVVAEIIVEAYAVARGRGQP